MIEQSDATDHFKVADLTDPNSSIAIASEPPSRERYSTGLPLFQSLAEPYSVAISCNEASDIAVRFGETVHVYHNPSYKRPFFSYFTNPVKPLPPSPPDSAADVIPNRLIGHPYFVIYTINEIHNFTGIWKTIYPSEPPIPSDNESIKPLCSCSVCSQKPDDHTNHNHQKLKIRTATSLFILISSIILYAYVFVVILM